MKLKKNSGFRIFFVLGILFSFYTNAIAQTLYVNGTSGSDDNPATLEKPLKTIARAAKFVNKSTEPGPTTIKIAPGAYCLAKTVVFENSRKYTRKNRLVIEATVLPDEPGWKPTLMPIIFSAENTKDPAKPDKISGSYGIKIKISHVTIRGVKFLGSCVPNNMYAPIERIGSDLDDLLVTQCMFIGDRDSFDIYCPVIATGDELVVDHCIFHNCHASAVYWDGMECIGGKNNVMRYCIVNGGLSGVWTCQTSDDFEFHHNIITDTEYFWIRKKIDNPIEYKIEDCIIDVNNFSGYGVESGPTGQTGPEVKFNKKNVVKNGKVVLLKNKLLRRYLHPVAGTPGYDLGAGLFKKKQ